MHATAAAASRRSPWAGLDALVLEEIEALRTSPPPLRRAPLPPAPDFATDEEFLMRVLRYLAGHPDPAALVASLSAGFPSAPDSEPEGAAATSEEPAPLPGDETDVPGEGTAAGEADDEANEEERS